MSAASISSSTDLSTSAMSPYACASDSSSSTLLRIFSSMEIVLDESTFANCWLIFLVDAAVRARALSVIRSFSYLVMVDLSFSILP